MWRRIAVSVVSSGCGFQSSVAGDARPGVADDAAADVAIDVMPAGATECWPRWRAHDVRLRAPVPLTALSSNGLERDPWISADGKRLYFASAPTGDVDIYLATRSAVSVEFSAAAKLVDLSRTGTIDARPALSGDEKLVVLSSNRDGRFDIFLSARADAGATFPAPDARHLGNVNGTSSSTNHYDPFLTGDGRRLYLAPAMGSAPQRIMSATRPTIDDDFTTPVVVPMINTTGAASDSDPALSPDELVIVFSSNRTGGPGSDDLYYATRAAPNQSFGPPALIPDVNNGMADGDPMLSADGCELYFASIRGGNFDLYVARVER